MLVSIMGDSISTYEGFLPEGYSTFYDEPTCKKNGLETVRDTWWMQVLESLEAELLVNNSYSGSQVTGEEFPCASGLQRTNALKKPSGLKAESKNVGAGEMAGVDGKARNSATKTPECDGRSERRPDLFIIPDLVLVYIGVNDFGFAVPCDRRHAETPDEPTFHDAYLTMIRRIQSSCPKSRIICATILAPRIANDPVWSFDEKWKDRTPLSEFNEQIRRAAVEANALLADLANRAGDMRYDTLDGLHPDKEGHRQIARLWMKELERLGIRRQPGESTRIQERSATPTSPSGWERHGESSSPAMRRRPSSRHR